MRTMREKVHYLLKIAALALVYCIAARLSLFLAFANTNASPVWPPSAIGFGALLFMGYRMWPGVLIGALVANTYVFLANQFADPVSVIIISLLIGIGNTLEAVTGVYLLRRLIASHDPLDRARDVFKFVLVVLVMCLTSSLIGPTVLCLSGHVPWELYRTTWFTWWMGDVSGIITFSPILLALHSHSLRLWQRERFLEAGLLLIILVITNCIIFGGQFPVSVRHYPVDFIFIPFIVWASFRFEKTGLGLTLLLTSGFAIWGTINGYGPFVHLSLNDALLLLQMFIGIVTVLGIMLSAVLAERREAEEKMHQYTLQLKQSNEELEQFAFVASHDLQEPLRIIASYVQLFIKRYKDAMDPTGEKYVMYINTNVERIQEMIAGLLDYSRIGRKEQSFKALDMGEMCDQAAANLKMYIAERRAQVTRDWLPAVRGSKTEMVRLFQNLINNAIKYCDKDVPLVHICVSKEKDTWLFSVKDNGIGIDGEFCRQIFEIFRRLHTRGEYPGTGIGLAICKKIVEKNGGHIWVESVPGQGSTFYFTIPRDKDGVHEP